MRFNVAIRTISLFAGGEAVYNVGGGVVFDSEAEAEYRECLLKARFATGMEPASS
jgi:para-aminobenzoate synthetase component 1